VRPTDSTKVLVLLVALAVVRKLWRERPDKLEAMGERCPPIWYLGTFVGTGSAARAAAGAAAGGAAARGAAAGAAAGAGAQAGRAALVGVGAGVRAGATRMLSWLNLPGFLPDLDADLALLLLQQPILRKVSMGREEF